MMNSNQAKQIWRGDPEVPVYQTIVTKKQHHRLLTREILLLFSVFSNFVLLGALIAKKPTVQECIKLTSAYSPLYDRYQINLSPRLSVNSSLEPGLTPSIYRQAPSAEVDAAWSRITSTHLFPLRREEVLRMGKDPDFTPLMPEEFGFGKDMHAGFMDVFHKIHCLDVLRREAHSDYYGAASKSPLGQAHVDHCIYILLDGLMCKPNMQVIPYIWLEGHPTPTPDFVDTDVCWDFEDVISWKATHGHLNDRSYYDLYGELRSQIKQTPVTEGWVQLKNDEVEWKAKNSDASWSASKHEH